MLVSGDVCVCVGGGDCCLRRLCASVCALASPSPLHMCSMFVLNGSAKLFDTPWGFQERSKSFGRLCEIHSNTCMLTWLCLIKLINLVTVSAHPSITSHDEVHGDTSSPGPRSVPVVEGMVLEEEVQATVEGRAEAGAHSQWPAAWATGVRERRPHRSRSQTGREAELLPEACCRYATLPGEV